MTSFIPLYHDAETIPYLRALTKELQQEIVSYLYPLPSISNNLAFRLAVDIFTKPRFSCHIRSDEGLTLKTSAF